MMNIEGKRIKTKLLVTLDQTSVVKYKISENCNVIQKVLVKRCINQVEH